MTAHETPSPRVSVQQSDPPRRHVTKREAIFAARTKVILDRKRGRTTEQWIKDLASEDDLKA